MPEVSWNDSSGGKIEMILVEVYAEITCGSFLTGVKSTIAGVNL